MQEVASQLRLMQFIAHNGHNLASGPNFLEDHEFLGELYEEYQEDYDSIIERAIGNGEKIDPFNATLDAAKDAKGVTEDTSKTFKALLDQEMKLSDLLDSETEGASEGTKTLLQDLSNASEERVYKIERRLK